jgi:DNA/RNA-binding domain of Phe-tRNA-synthetase-like protein
LSDFGRERCKILTLTDAWKAAYPDSHAGILALREVTNPSQHAELEKQKTALEEELRARYGGEDRKALESLPALGAYAAYYRRFKKTYHVQLQLESIAHRNKPIPSVAALVEAMFMAEVKNMLLTAGHDLDLVRAPIFLDVARGEEQYVLLRGQPQAPKAGDMIIRDGEGIISSIVYGPDLRTQIRPETRRVLFTVYAPAGIDTRAVQTHLEDIHRYVLLFCPQAQVERLQVYGAAE